MNIRAMICALRFSRLTVLFLVVQTVLACAFLCNALAFLVEQAGPMLTPTGVASDQVLYVDRIQLLSGFDPTTGSFEGGASTADLHTLEARIRALPGVTSVSVGVGLPYTGTLRAERDYYGQAGKAKVHVSAYYGDHLLDALGLELVNGRDFHASEIGHMPMGGSSASSVVIVSQAVAKRLYPAGNALGKRLHMDQSDNSPGPVIVGIVRHLPARQPLTLADTDMAVIVPALPVSHPMINVVVRVSPEQRAAVAGQLPALITDSLHMQPVYAGMVRVQTFDAIHDAYYRSTRSLVWLMFGVTLAVVVITVIGIMGLTGFWVQRRTRTIGIRRALGATRAAIVRHFLLENLLIVGLGVMLGVVAAYAGNLWLMTHLAMSRLPWPWLPIGAVVLLVLGQLAALIPARRAAAVPPVVATRSV